MARLLKHTDFTVRVSDLFGVGVFEITLCPLSRTFSVYLLLDCHGVSKCGEGRDRIEKKKQTFFVYVAQKTIPVVSKRGFIRILLYKRLGQGDVGYTATGRQPA